MMADEPGAPAPARGIDIVATIESRRKIRQQRERDLQAYNGLGFRMMVRRGPGERWEAKRHCASGLPPRSRPHTSRGPAHRSLALKLSTGPTGSSTPSYPCSQPTLCGTASSECVAPARHSPNPRQANCIAPPLPPRLPPHSLRPRRRRLRGKQTKLRWIHNRLVSIQEEWLRAAAEEAARRRALAPNAVPQNPDQVPHPKSERDGVTTITKIQYLEAELSRLREAMEKSGAAPAAQAAQAGHQAPGPPPEANPDDPNAPSAPASSSAPAPAPAPAPPSGGAPPPERRPSRAHLDSALKAMSSRLRHVERCAACRVLPTPPRRPGVQHNG